MVGYSWTDPAVLTFFAMPIGLVGALLWLVDLASRRLDEPAAGRHRALVATAAGAVAWMTVTWIAASSGVLRQWDATPPPIAVLVAGIVALSVAIAFSPYGTRIATGVPIALLIALQGFRLRGVMPVQMSYSGRNFDIITGISAFVVAWLVAQGLGGRLLITIWNLMGVALLVNVVTIAILSTPRFR
jgi:hypothetical protein